MFASFFAGWQQDLKLALLAPALCAVFRLIFIEVYGSQKSPRGVWRKWFECFRYGFWWGMLTHTYVYLASLVLVTLPSTFFASYYAWGDTVRLVLGLFYAILLYTAFAGKMIFYYHFHDIYNGTLWLGQKAEKNNLLDIFFHQNHGGWILAGYVPYLALCYGAWQWLLGLPSLVWPDLSAWPLAARWGVQMLVFLLSVALYYFIRYRCSFDHRNEPEWDEIPPIVKADAFMSKATVDDLVALLEVWHNPPDGLMKHTDAEDTAALHQIMTPMQQARWQGGNPAEAFVRTAQGARITPPRHIFLIVGESYSQMPFDDIYQDYHLVDKARALRAEPHTAVLNNFLPAGMVSRPAIVSLMSGIYDARLQLNEQERFWYGNLPVSLPRQLARLGYRSIYWYGGGATNGSFDKYAPGMGFERVMSATNFCPADAPRTWVGVYDHIFLREAARLIREMGTEQPTFHFVYTTSNHGPYTIPLEAMQFDADAVMPDIPEEVRHDKARAMQLGTHWYTDQAIGRFIEEMRTAYPDSLFIVTGDHSHMPIQPRDTLARQDITLREQFCTSFMLLHPEIDQSLLAGNTIGCHMNIAPTLFELIAPQGFAYYAYFQPLTEHIDHVVTPYHWLDREAIGPADKPLYQALTVTGEPLPMQEAADGQVRYAAERQGLEAITGWIARHPECLQGK